ncbi:hypothetical protein ACWIGM_17150 [Bosea sp. NPDC055332]
MLVLLGVSLGLALFLFDMIPVLEFGQLTGQIAGSLLLSSTLKTCALIVALSCLNELIADRRHVSDM